MLKPALCNVCSSLQLQLLQRSAAQRHCKSVTYVLFQDKKGFALQGRAVLFALF